MVFVIQNAQNRDTRAIQIKLDELLRAISGARTGLVDIERLSDQDLAALQERFAELRERHADETLAAEEPDREQSALPWQASTPLRRDRGERLTRDDFG